MPSLEGALTPFFVIYIFFYLVMGIDMKSIEHKITTQVKMVVAVKQDENAFQRNHFTEIVSKSIAKVVKDSGKAFNPTIGKDEEILGDELRAQLDKRNNIKAILSLLTEDDKQDFINEIVALYKISEFRKNNYGIYNSVKNKMSVVEVKENSKKFLSAIQQEVEITIDLQDDEFKQKLWRIWETLNNTKCVWGVGRTNCLV